MLLFETDDVSIAYLDEGSGDVVLLSHGFASNKEVNWIETGWVRFLIREGFRVIAVDHRGHGASQKFYDSNDYSIEIIARDMMNLIDSLDIKKVHVIGYSMGARAALRFCGLFADRVKRVAIGGAGGAVLKDRSDWRDVAEGLLADDLSGSKTPRAVAFRQFAQRTKSDRKALAACVMGVLEPIPTHHIEQIKSPVLLSVGTRDDVAGDPNELAKYISDCRVFSQPGKDHMSAVGDREWKQEVVEFFGA